VTSRWRTRCDDCDWPLGCQYSAYPPQPASSAPVTWEPILETPHPKSNSESMRLKACDEMIMVRSKKYSVMKPSAEEHFLENRAWSVSRLERASTREVKSTSYNS
jgi:hypothetical protein